jgi:hypothetical protein
MNNKPIAWINEYDGLESFNPDNRQEWIPLYTHPAKTLTDEEINEIFSKTWLDLKDYKEFARAILRKAQEK